MDRSLSPDPLPDDRFRALAGSYDQWIGWEPRLQKELPFLVESLPPAATSLFPDLSEILDVGCGTGAHAVALAAAGYRVTGIDRSAAMLQAAGEAEKRAREAGRLPRGCSLQWIEGDIRDPAVLRDRWYRGVLALGNALLSLGDEESVRQGLKSMARLVAPGGVLILQYLNGTKIRRQGRLVVKAAPTGSPATEPAGSEAEIWLRHHFEAGGELYFHSYVVHPAASPSGPQVWSAEVTRERLVDLTAETILALLQPQFDRVELYDGLSGKPFSLEESDAVGVRAVGRR